MRKLRWSALRQQRAIRAPVVLVLALGCEAVPRVRLRGARVASDNDTFAYWVSVRANDCVERVLSSRKMRWRAGLTGS